MKDEIKEILELYKNDDIEYYNLVSDLGYDKLLNYITNLQEENEKLSVELNKNMIERNNYLSKNGKAIEYIKMCRDYHKTYHNEDKMFPDELTSLIMMLKGEDKE